MALHVRCFACYNTVICRQTRETLKWIMFWQITSIIDLTPYLGTSGVIRPGGSTQCSDNESMWVAIDHGGVNDTILTIK